MHIKVSHYPDGSYFPLNRRSFKLWPRISATLYRESMSGGSSSSRVTQERDVVLMLGRVVVEETIVCAAAQVPLREPRDLQVLFLRFGMRSSFHAYPHQMSFSSYSGHTSGGLDSRILLESSSWTRFTSNRRTFRVSPACLREGNASSGCGMRTSQRDTLYRAWCLSTNRTLRSSISKKALTPRSFSSSR